MSEKELMMEIEDLKNYIDILEEQIISLKNDLEWEMERSSALQDELNDVVEDY